MTLRTVQVDNPAPGREWSTTVPGRYLYNVTGITATLTTVGDIDELRDLSGNGNDGTYVTTAPFGAFVPGLLVGSNAWQPGAAPVAPAFTGATIPHGLFDRTSPFTVAWWAQYDPSEAGGSWAGLIAYDGVMQLCGIDGTVSDGTPGSQPIRFSRPGSGWASSATALVADGIPHHVAITYNGVDTVTLYVDGVMSPWVITGTVGGPGTAANATTVGDGSVGSGTYQDLAVFPTALSAGDIANLYAAGAGGVGAYEPEVLSLGANALYRLDTALNGGARQVLLAVSVPEGPVEEIPTGFEPATVAGPYRYSWQPAASSSTQSAGGALTTVAIPQLILPAGYTLSSVTLDMQPTDQWSAITVWWNDDAMMVNNAFNPFVYAPGAHLVYRRVGV